MFLKTYFYVHFQLFAIKKQTFYEIKKPGPQAKDDQSSNTKTPEKNIFIDQLIKLSLKSNIFTESEVQSELRTMLLAVSLQFQRLAPLDIPLIRIVYFKKGFETTATCCATMFALIAIHQDVQEKLFQEIRSVLTTPEQEVTRDDIKEMPYLDAFIKESLRIFPTVPFVTRIVRQEIKIGS